MVHSRFARATVLRPDLNLPLEARGQLRLDTPSGHTLDFVADGETLRLEAPRLQDMRTLVPRSFRRRGQTVRELGKLLTAYGLTLNMESAGQTVLQLGRAARPNWLARLLGLAPARIPLAALMLLFRR